MKGKSYGRSACFTLATVVILALIAASCYGPNDNTPTSPTVSYKISIASNNVSGPVGQEISTPLGVFVGNSVNYEQPGVRVNFAVIEGEATLNPASAITDTSGIAYTKVTPGYAPGPITIRATVFATNLSVELTATGTP